jgi:DNA modification methylase
MTLKIKTHIPNTAVREAAGERTRRRSDHLKRAAEVEAVSVPRNDLVPGLTMVNRRPQDLKLWGRQVRKHDMAQIARVKGAIQTYGFVAPILINGEDGIIDGMTRLEAALQLGMPEVPCLVVDHLTDTQLRTLKITLNRTAETGVWDFGELQFEFGELQVLGAPLEITGFSIPEIDAIMLEPDPAEEREVEDAPAIQPVAVSRLGDIWRLGKHRLVCGDARDANVYSVLMTLELAQLVFTDIPYNVPVAGHVTSGDHREFAMASGEMSQPEFEGFNRDLMGAALPHMVDGGIFGTFIDWRGLGTVEAAARTVGLNQINLIVWTKQNGGMGTLYRSKHELLPLFKKGKAAHINNVQLGKFGRYRTNVWSYPGASSLGSDARAGLAMHPTVKPVAMLQDALLDLTNPDQIVIDPFCGSGSTLIAAEKTGRRCRAIELDPLYVDVIVRRWMKLTGKAAMHEETGLGFDEIAQQRTAGAALNEEAA